MAEVAYNARRRRHEVVLRLDPDEADNIAYALGTRDGAFRELTDAAERCRTLDGQEAPGDC